MSVDVLHAMAVVLTWNEIAPLLEELDLISEIEQGFVAHANGRSHVPPVGELTFVEPSGEAHIKYGYIEGDTHFLVKVATGFYDNASLGLPTSSGVMLLFSRRTGELAAVLLDEGRLTDLRTAVAGAIAAKYLAPKKVTAIGIIGTGTQARHQLDQLRHVTDCRRVRVWGRRTGAAEAFAEEWRRRGYEALACGNASEVAAGANLLVTATPSTSPLLFANEVRPGTHITAVGADSPAKNEIDPAIFAMADLIVVDSLSQCSVRGELHHALVSGMRLGSKPIELGQVLAGTHRGRTDESQITIADLTGVAVQDIRTAEAVFARHLRGTPRHARDN